MRFDTHKSLAPILTVFVWSFLFTACTAAPAKKMKEENLGSLPGKMVNLGSSITPIFPYAFDDAKYSSPKNREKILVHLKNMRKAVHTIAPEQMDQLLGKDPLVALSLNRLKEDVSRSLETFASGNYKYSQHLVQNAINHCYSCHTRAKLGPEYDFWGLEGLNLETLNTEQRIKILIATRQFKVARKSIEEALGRDSANYSIEQAIKDYLTITVKVDESPENGIRFLTRVSDAVPSNLKNTVGHWRQSLLRWKGAKIKGESISLETANELIKTKPLKRVRYGSNYKFVDYLRAASLLHKYLGKNISSKQRSKIYRDLGYIYNTIDSPQFWDIPERYFELCILEFPNSEIARSCFKNYELNIYSGYSGSGGIFLPVDERRRIKKLKEKSGLSRQP